MKTKNPNHHLVLRGLTWWCRLPLQNGKQREINTDFSEGEVEKARAKRDELLEPFRIKSQSSALAVIESMRKEKDVAYREAVKKANRLKIVDAWDAFPYVESSGKGLKKSIRKLTPQGIETAKSQWTTFVQWAEGRGLKFLDEIGEQEARDYIAFLVADGLSGSTINKKMFTAGVMLRNAMGVNPFQPMTKRASNYQSRRALSPDEIEKVWEVLDARIESKIDQVKSLRDGGKKIVYFPRAVKAEQTARRIEDKKLFALLLYTGMRLSDCITLTGEHFFNGEIHRETGKDEKNVGFPVVEKLKAILGDIPKTGFILPCLAGDYVADGNKSHRISERFRRIFEACGFDRLKDRADGKRKVSLIGAHSLRHTFVQIVMDAGVSVDDVRRWIGHNSSIVTQIYNRNPRATMNRIAEAIGRV